MYYPSLEALGKHDASDSNLKYDFQDQYHQYGPSESFPRHRPLEQYSRHDFADPYARADVAEVYLKYDSPEPFQRYEVADTTLRRILPETHSRYEHSDQFHPMERAHSEAHTNTLSNSGVLAYPGYPLATQPIHGNIPEPSFPILSDLAFAPGPTGKYELPNQDREVYLPTISTPNASYLWSEPPAAEVSPPQQQEDFGPKAEFHSHTCTVCGRQIQRDISRHMRTHMPEPRFYCPFPLGQCRHRSRRFNRPYDYKKHLLNRHFTFDDPAVKKMHNLGDKLPHRGTCGCGARFTGQDWLENHICTSDTRMLCAIVSCNANSVSTLPASFH